MAKKWLCVAPGSRDSATMRMVLILLPCQSCLPVISMITDSIDSTNPFPIDEAHINHIDQTQNDDCD